MRRTLAFLSMLGVCLGAISPVGCGSSNKSAPKQTSQVNLPPAKQGQAQDGPAWKVTLKTSCQNVDAVECVANYGFTVIANSHFQVGPAPQGQTVVGSLTADEFKSISTLITSALPTVTRAQRNQHETCKPLDQTEEYEGQDTVTLSRPQNQDLVLLTTKGNDLCSQSATPDVTQALHKAIHALANKYYTLPFPDACLDAATAMEAIYPSVQSCSTDADCAYVDTSFNVIPSADEQFVVTDDCTVVTPLSVGNAKAVASAQAKLQAALDHVRDVCGERIVRNECTGISGFQSSAGSPVCKLGVCQSHPDLPSLN